MRKPRNYEYVCPACRGRLAEYWHDNVGHLVCVKCERIAGFGFLVSDVSDPIPGQTTIEEFLDAE